MQRVLVVGCSGAGKSTLSRRLARMTGLPRIELDQHFWRAGWIALSPDEWRAKVAELSAELAWIMDGNYASSLDIRLPRVDTVFWLDHPRHLCVRRVLGRVAGNSGRCAIVCPRAARSALTWNFCATSGILMPSIGRALKRRSKNSAHMQRSTRSNPTGTWSECWTKSNCLVRSQSACRDCNGRTRDQNRRATVDCTAICGFAEQRPCLRRQHSPGAEHHSKGQRTGKNQ